MYTVNLLNEELHEWQPLTFNGKIMQFSSKGTLCKALKDNLGKHQQVVYNDWYLVGLDGSLYQLNWFIDSHNRLVNKVEHYMSSQENYDNKLKKEKVLLKEAINNDLYSI